MAHNSLMIAKSFSLLRKRNRMTAGCSTINIASRAELDFLGTLAYDK
jgi:hypothetical protein